MSESYKLKIMFLHGGYSIFMDDGITPMEFVDKTPTAKIGTLKEAIKICIDHDYGFDVIG